MTEPDLERLGSRVYDLMPRIVASRAREAERSEQLMDVSLAALSASLLTLNTEMQDLASIVGPKDSKVLAIAAIVHNLADSVVAMLDAIDIDEVAEDFTV